MRRNSPPAFACRLVESVLPSRYPEAMLGDLIEEYTLRAESTSPSAATRWFCGQACRSIPFIFGSSLRTGDWLISVSAATGVWVVTGMLKFAAGFMITKVVAPQPTTYIVLAPIVFSHNNVHRRVCRCANSLWHGGLPRLHRDDYGWCLDCCQCLPPTCAVVVSVRISNTGASVGAVDAGALRVMKPRSEEPTT